MQNKPEYEIEVGKDYENKSGEIVKVTGINLDNGIMGWFYTVYVSNSSYYTYKSHIVHFKHGPVQKFTTHYDMLTPVLTSLPTTGPKIYRTNGKITFMNSKGNTYDLDKEEVENWLKEGITMHTPYGSSFASSLIKCNHNWVTTIGFNSEYIDCSKCGAKKEEV